MINIVNKPRPARRAGLFVALMVPAAVSLTATSARAQTPPTCASLNLPNPIYGDGGSAAQPYIGKLGRALANLSTPVTLVFKASGACNGIYGLLQPTPLSGTVFYWDAAGAQLQCTLPATGGPNIQWANMVNSHKLCDAAPAALPATIGDVEGPVTAVNFITAKASSEVSISSEAAYLAYGFGAASRTAPWTVEALLFKRNQASAVGLYAGIAAGVQPSQQKGTLIANQTAAIMGVANAVPASAGLGYVSSDAADLARDTTKTLAYQHKNQICGYLPDSTSTSFDKKNVRDGHYWLWGAQHFFGAVDATSKQFTDPNVAKLIGLVTGTVAPPAGTDVTQLAIDTGNVPRCAMSVWRDGDLGELYSYAPPEPCGCFYEKNVQGGSTSCTACTTDTNCAAAGATSKCRHGFCEAY